MTGVNPGEWNLMQKKCHESEMRPTWSHFHMGNEITRAQKEKRSGNGSTG